MPPKKSAAAAKPKATASASARASYIDMIKDAIINLKDRNGSSRQAIQKYILANNTLGNQSETAFRNHVNRAIASGKEKGDLAQPKGPSGPVKLAKKEAKPAATPKKSDIKVEKKLGPEKPVTTKAKTTPKKVASKKTAATKTTTKKSAAKPKANASKPRKTAAPAPAVEEQISRVLGKTKSGRVTKTTAPSAPSATKKSTTKKTATPKKAATPKKKATPKKATPRKSTT